MRKEILYEGKSKIVYRAERDDLCVIEYKDTATAFNGVKKEQVRDKGRLNAAISNHIFQYLEENGIKTHLVKILDEKSILAQKAEMIPVEVIVRNIAAGSFSQKYGVPEGTSLKNVVLEYCLKDDRLGDPMINEMQITALGLASREELEAMARIALRINALIAGLFARARVTLVDFKIEFGRYGGAMLLCDEISPDSCRLWDADTQKKLDKDRFRRDLGEVTESYAEVLRRIKNAG